MTRCPVCLGDGEFDLRDSDALLAEHLPADVWAQIGPAGIVPCVECGGSGEVTDARARDIEAWVVSRMDQLFALAAEREARSAPIY